MERRPARSSTTTRAYFGISIESPAWYEIGRALAVAARGARGWLSVCAPGSRAVARAAHRPRRAEAGAAAALRLLRRDLGRHARRGRALSVRLDARIDRRADD